MSVSLSAALRQAKISGVDWFKCDTQGTDLRLFKSLDPAIREKVLVAELEPGILDAYLGEDKLGEVLQYMDKLGFFMSSMDVKGTQRITVEEMRTLSPNHQRAMAKCLIKSPGWAELCYLNTLRLGKFDRRAWMLAYMFSWIEGQYGFAIEIANRAYATTGEAFFLELKDDGHKKIRNNNWSLPRVMLKKVANKLLSYL